MRRIVAGVLAVLLLSACAATEETPTPVNPTSTAVPAASDLPDEAPLGEWVKSAGFMTMLESTALAVKDISAALTKIESTDYPSMAAVLKDHADVFTAQATALRNQVPCSDAEYERQKLALATAMATYADAAAALVPADLATDSDPLAAVLTQLEDVTTALNTLGEYVVANADTTVTRA